MKAYPQFPSPDFRNDYSDWSLLLWTINSQILNRESVSSSQSLEHNWSWISLLEILQLTKVTTIRFRCGMFCLTDSETTASTRMHRGPLTIFLHPFSSCRFFEILSAIRAISSKCATRHTHTHTHTFTFHLSHWY